LSFDSLLDNYRTRLSTDGTTIREQYIDLLRDNFLDSFENNVSYKTVKYKKKNEDSHFFLDAHVFRAKTDSEKVGLDDYKRVIFKKLDFMPDRGDMLEFDDYNWIILRVNTVDFIKSCIIGKCNNVITLYKNGIKYEYPILIEDQVRLYQLGIKATTYITEPSSIKIFRVSCDDITINTIKRGYIYKIGIANYRIIDVDDILNPGLLVVKIEFSQQQQDVPHEKENENEKVINGYEIIGDSDIFVGQSKFYQAVKYVDGEIDQVAKFNFSIHGDTPIDKYVLKIINEQSCEIKAKDYDYIIILRATDIDSEEYVEKQIILEGLF
jgi:hypothetical protein